MAKYFLTVDTTGPNAGRIVRTEATVASSGVGNAGDLVALDASGYLDATVLPPGIGADTIIVVASENLSAGNVVDIWSDAGTVKVRKADATSAGKEANGFVKDNFASGASATVYMSGKITGLVGLMPGARYFLATTPGAITATPPTTAGNVLQLVGEAVSTTELLFTPDSGYIL